ncbi:MAG: hypothetical protein HC907_37640 [Richelia sp. SM1_7_0]|nr:hypothetical protein [Richelia sp. SM1_7_0]
MSALDEFCRMQSLPRPNLSLASKLENYFDDFHNYLKQSVILNRDVIQLERACNQTLQVIEKFDFNINLVSQLTQTDQLSTTSNNIPNRTSELHQKVEQLQHQIKSEITQLRQQANYWIVEFMQRMQTETITQLDKSSLDEIRCHFPFFLTEKLRQAVYECMNIHQPIIIDKLQKLETSILSDLYNLTEITLTGAI